MVTSRMSSSPGVEVEADDGGGGRSGRVDLLGARPVTDRSSLALGLSLGLSSCLTSHR